MPLNDWQSAGGDRLASDEPGADLIGTIEAIAPAARCGRVVVLLPGRFFRPARRTRSGAGMAWGAAAARGSRRRHGSAAFDFFPDRRAWTRRGEAAEPRRKRQRMNSESIMTHLPNGETLPVHDRIVGESPLARPELNSGTAIIPGEQLAPTRSLVQWGPILAGFFSATAIFLLLTALGIAIGASVLEPRAGGAAIGPWPAVWAAITIIVAFLFGGWVASRSTLAGSRFSHVMDGFVVGAAGLTLIVWWSTIGLGDLFGAIGQDVARILATAGATNPQAFDLVRQGGFITFVWFLLPLLAATLGGYLGEYRHVDLLHRRGVAVR